METKEKVIELCKRVLKVQNSVDSYKLLVLLIHNKYKYKDDFKEILNMLKEEPDIRYDSKTDCYTYYEEVKINVQILGNRHNCTNCLFRLTKDDIESRQLQSKIKGMEKDDIICTLRPLDRAYNRVYWPDWFKCPINEALDKEEEQSNE